MHVAWLCRFLPATYQEHVPVLIEGDFEKEKANSAWKKKSYRLNLVCSLFRLDLNSVAVYLCLSEAAWLVAWDRYAMVAHGLGQLAYKDSQLHKANVCEIAFSAADKDCTELLGVLYDELVREQWASMSAKVRTYRVENQVCIAG